MAYRSPDLIPLAPLRRVLENWMRTTTSLDPTLAISRLIWPDADETGRVSTRLSKLLGQDLVTFDLADLILTRLNLTHLWHEDPELRNIYQKLDLTWLDVAKPTCDKVDARNRQVAVRAHRRNGGLVTYTALDMGLPVAQVRRLLAAA